MSLKEDIRKKIRGISIPVVLSNTETRVYNLIKSGYLAGGHGNLVGCTDIELTQELGITNSTIRWARWRLQRKGVLKKAGFKRAFRIGLPELDVYIVTEKIDLTKCDLPDSERVVVEEEHVYGRTTVDGWIEK